MRVIYFTFFGLGSLALGYIAALYNYTDGEPILYFAGLLFTVVFCLFAYLFRHRMHDVVYLVHPLSFDYGPLMAIGCGFLAVAGLLMQVEFYVWSTILFLLGSGLLIRGLIDGPVYGYDI